MCAYMRRNVCVLVGIVNVKTRLTHTLIHAVHCRITLTPWYCCLHPIYITNFICTVESKHAVRLRRVQQTNMQRDQINDSLYRLISQLHAYTNAPQPGSKLIFLPDFSIWSGISLDVMTIMKKWKLATFYELSCIFMRFFRISSGFWYKWVYFSHNTSLIARMHEFKWSIHKGHLK